MLTKTAVFFVAVALPAIHGFGLGGDNNVLSSKLNSLLSAGGNNRPITTTTTYTLPPPSTITVSPATPPTSPIVYYTPTYVPTPFPVPVPAAADEEILPPRQTLADAVDESTDSARRRKRVQRVFPKRKRKGVRRNRRRD